MCNFGVHLPMHVLYNITQSPALECRVCRPTKPQTSQAAPRMYLNIILPVCWNVIMLISLLKCDHVDIGPCKTAIFHVNIDVISEINHSWIFMAPLHVNILFNSQPCIVSGHIIAKKYGCEIHTWYYFDIFVLYSICRVFLSCFAHVLNIADETIDQMCSRWCINC